MVSLLSLSLTWSYVLAVSIQYYFLLTVLLSQGILKKHITYFTQSKSESYLGTWLLTDVAVAGLKPLTSICFAFIAFICMRAMIREKNNVILMWMFSWIVTHIKKQLTWWVETKMSKWFWWEIMRWETTKQVSCTLGNVELWLSNSCTECLPWRINQIGHKMSLPLFCSSKEEPNSCKWFE